MPVQRSKPGEAVTELSNEVHNNAVTLARISAEILSISKTVASLALVVRDGNGNSLITRLALVESRLNAIDTALVGVVSRINEHNIERVKGSYNIAFGVLTGILGIIATLLSLWLKGSLN